MSTIQRSFFLYFLICVLHLAPVCADFKPPPQIYIWTWDYPQDFSKLQLPPNAGVAFLAGTIHITKAGIYGEPRHCRMVAPSSIPLISVCRIELSPDFKEPLDQKLANKVCDLIIKYGHVDKINKLQIDFDARLNERSFYKKIIATLQQRTNVKLSITALVSWCMFDSWLDKMNNLEIVPMFFSMGLDRNNILEYFKNHPGYPGINYADNIGISLMESKVNKIMLFNLYQKNHFHLKTLYVFNPHPWTSFSLINALEYIK